MKYFSLCLGALLSLNLALAPVGYALAEDLRPRIVKKDYDGEVPAGMHLVRTRTGELWMLPEEMDSPPEAEVVVKYYKPKRGTPEAQQIGLIGKHKHYDRGLPAEEIFQDDFDVYEFLPKKFSKALWQEKHENLHAQESADLLSLGDFGPARDRAFLVPYIPLPEEAMDFAYLIPNSRADTKNLVRFMKDGKPHYRFFVHPNHVDAYEDLIKKYGIVYHYVGISTSSPRSLILMDPLKPGKAHWVKPSLHKKLDGSVRINHEGKVRRAVIMSEAISNVPQKKFDDLNVQFMLEPAALVPKGKITGTIFREIHPEFLNPKVGRKWAPAFTLKAPSAANPDETNLASMIRKSRQSPEDFVREKIVRPLLHAYMGLGITEGLPGELHTQNFYYELNYKGLPTGRLMFKDNDGFRFDVELALRNKRKLGFLSHFDEPFLWAKYSNALGTGAERIPFLGSWYYKLIRNVNGFETLSAYCLEVLKQVEPRRRWNKDKIQELFDEVAMEEAEHFSGEPIEEPGYGRNKGVNIALNKFRAARSLEEGTVENVDAEIQAALSSEFARLKSSKRVSALRRGLVQKAYYLLHEMPDGSLVIEARTPKVSAAHPDPTIGFALVEPVGTKAGDKFRDKLGVPPKKDCSGLLTQ